MSMMVMDETPATNNQPYNSKVSEAIVRLLRRGATSHLTQLLSKLRPAELSGVLNGFPETRACEVFALILPHQLGGQVFDGLSEKHKKHLLTKCNREYMVAVLRCCSPDVQTRHLALLDKEEADAFHSDLHEEILDELDLGPQEYEKNTAGAIMDTQLFSMTESTTAAAAIQAVQGLSSHDSVFYLYVVDDHGCLTGVCSLRKLILAEPNQTLKEFTHSRLIKVHVNTPQGVVASQISRYRLLAMPVVDDVGVLVGQITIDNLIHVIQDETTSVILKMAGIDSKKTDVLSQSPFAIFGTRVPWLISAFIAYLLVSAILDGFEETLEAVVQLAFFFPIVIGMSGNAGSQTGTVVVRGLALGIIHSSHFFKLLFKELGVNIIQGSIYGLCLAVASYFIFHNHLLSITLGTAMALSITFASAIAMSLPFFFKKIGADPAVAAGPLALAFIDMVGSINYLMIAFTVFNL
ncbi:MAG: magnesium transporter [Magnetococcales bacterium]|nr:magnesium transporter [Magnetococcales bacterium]